MNVKRVLFNVVMVLASFLLQCTLFQRLSLADIKPNLLLIVTASFGFIRGKKEGLFMGFFSGLLLDIFSGGMIGFYALIYMVLGYINGLFHRLFFEDDIKLPLFLICGGELAYGLVIYITQYLLRSRFDFLYYFFHIILPELIYTILITLFLYQVILKINQKLQDQEQRSASKFV